MLSDNYCYYVFDPEQPENGVYIDVARAEELEVARLALGLPSLYDTQSISILTTHKHWDHSQGNVEIPKLFPKMQVTVVANVEDHVPGANVQLNFTQDRVREVVVLMPTVKVIAINTPCHSAGSVIFSFESLPKEGICEDWEPEETLVTANVSSQHPAVGCAFPSHYKVVHNVQRCVFTGDTVFVGGCGKFFEGQANQMVNNMDLFTGNEDEKAFFSPDTRIFPGHEYAEVNLKFNLEVLETVEHCELKDTIR
jgi:hydroxyacylglutathione hydrolase